MGDKKFTILGSKSAVEKYLTEESILQESFLLGCYSVLLHKMNEFNKWTIRVNNSGKQSVLCVSVDGGTKFTELLLDIQNKISGCCCCQTEDSGDCSETPLFYYSDKAFCKEELEKYQGKKDRINTLYCLSENNAISYCFNLDDETETLMEGRLQKIVDEFLSNPQITIKDISIINSTEDEIIKKFIVSPKRKVPDICFHQMFEQRAVEYPDRTAVIYADKKLSYRELNEKANQLAHYIHKKCKDTECLIGVFMERSIEYIISILGIMKSGNGYVPIDSDTLNPGHENFPVKRLEFMIRETNMPLIISKVKFQSSIPTDDSQILYIDDFDMSMFEKENLDLCITKNNMAYGIYTSGSTGYPKLTIVEHFSVMNLFTNIDAHMYKYISEKNNVVASVNAPFGFDASVQQLVALLKGYSISIIPENVRNSAIGLIQYIADNKMNVFDCTPSQLNLLLREKLLEKCSKDLDLILVGGEAIPNEMWDLLRKEKKIRIFNVYGPTECTVDSTYCLVNNNDSTEPHIGRPLDNNSIYILDDNMKNVPVGSVGELYISGYGVTRGYYNRPEMNNAHFITNPEINPKADKIYKTGDLGKFLANGDIYYMGRKDDQVKIRSHRIELKEIMENLNKHESVAEALVIVNSDSDYPKLIAYLIMNKNASLDEVEMNKFLAKYLPMYMLPNNYVIVEQWPLTKNGKIDKKRLPVPLEDRLESKEIQDSPSSELEISVAEVMKRILKINRIGVNENFMSLGGDSLRVMTLLAEIYNKFNVEVDYSEFFNKPNIANLVSLINREGR